MPKYPGREASADARLMKRDLPRAWSQWEDLERCGQGRPWRGLWRLGSFQVPGQQNGACSFWIGAMGVNWPPQMVDEQLGSPERQLGRGRTWELDEDHRQDGTVWRTWSHESCFGRNGLQKVAVDRIFLFRKRDQEVPSFLELTGSLGTRWSPLNFLNMFPKKLSGMPQYSSRCVKPVKNGRLHQSDLWLLGWKTGTSPLEVFVGVFVWWLRGLPSTISVLVVVGDWSLICSWSLTFTFEPRLHSSCLFRRNRVDSVGFFLSPCGKFCKCFGQSV